MSLKYWIDFKNLNKNNVTDALSLLDTLTSKYSIKADVIIESKNIELLYSFKKMVLVLVIGFGLSCN